MPLGRLIVVLFGLSLIFQASQPGAITPSNPSQEPPKALGSQITSPEVSKVTPSQSDTLTVTRVVDGDTIVLSTGQKIRYIGLDTPEMNGGCFANEAKEANERLVLNQPVRLEKDVSETDKYGRLVRFVWVGETFVNEYLVRQGFAKAYPYSPDISKKDLFAAAELEAIKSGRGIWAACNTSSTSTRSSASYSSPSSTPPDPNCPIKGNISSGGRIYHLPGGSYYNKTVIDESAGERWFCSETEAQAAGWRKSSR